MSLIPPLIDPLGKLIDHILPDPIERAKAKERLMEMENSQEVALLQARLSAIVAEAGAKDPWTSRARPSFLYVMYILFLGAVPMGVIAAFRPDIATAIGDGMNRYLQGLPEPLYALFGTGYLGYTAARQWGKVKGVER